MGYRANCSAAGRKWDFGFLVINCKSIWINQITSESRPFQGNTHEKHIPPIPFAPTSSTQCVSLSSSFPTGRLVPSWGRGVGWEEHLGFIHHRLVCLCLSLSLRSLSLFSSLQWLFYMRVVDRNTLLIFSSLLSSYCTALLLFVCRTLSLPLSASSSSPLSLLSLCQDCSCAG